MVLEATWVHTQNEKTHPYHGSLACPVNLIPIPSDNFDFVHPWSFISKRIPGRVILRVVVTSHDSPHGACEKHRLPAPEKTGHHLRPKRKTSGDLLEGAADVAIGISKGLFNHRVPVLAIFPGHALLQAALSYSTLGQFQKPPA